MEEGLTREWIITNGIGGFASSTIIGCNTRKYHGLLVAPLTPPARRYLILSKLDESIKFENGNEYNLYTNMCENYISDGYKNLETFEKDYIPIFTYKVKDTIIKKGNSSSNFKVSDLKIGQKIEVVFQGPEGRSYPVTANAYSINIIDEKN